MGKLGFRSRRLVRLCGGGLAAVFSAAGPAMGGTAQVEVAVGLIMAPEAGIGGRQVGPMISATGRKAVLGIPLEAGVARADFSSLGQHYHHHHYLFALGAEWLPTTGGTRVRFRLALGAYGEIETVEGNPPTPGGAPAETGFCESLRLRSSLEHSAIMARNIWQI